MVEFIKKEADEKAKEIELKVSTGCGGNATWFYLQCCYFFTANIIV